MAMPFLNHTENSLNFQKFKKKPKKSNLNSFWAFLLSIVIYVSVFYVFNLSPSTDLLCTTKFWFIISNTLILIIAADFEAYSSSKDRDFFDEYAKNIHAGARSSTIPSYDIVPYVRLDEKTMPKYPAEEAAEEPQEKIINMVVNDHHTQTQENVEDKPGEIFPTPEKLKQKRKKRESGQKVLKKRTERTLSAVEPEKEAGKVVLQRTLSERREEPPRLMEENEFSRMSDEELNRRVEEFIRRCNKQIRLEAVSNRRQG